MGCGFSKTNTPIKIAPIPVLPLQNSPNSHDHLHILGESRIKHHIKERRSITIVQYDPKELVYTQNTPNTKAPTPFKKDLLIKNRKNFSNNELSSGNLTNGLRMSEDFSVPIVDSLFNDNHNFDSVNNNKRSVKAIIKNKSNFSSYTALMFNNRENLEISSMDSTPDSNKFSIPKNFSGFFENNSISSSSKFKMGDSQVSLKAKKDQANDETPCFNFSKRNLFKFALMNDTYNNSNCSDKIRIRSH